MAHKLVDMARLPASELAHILRYGETPSFAALDGYLFHGANLVLPGRALFPKFVKGFFQEGRASGKRASMGYNIACERGPLTEPWRMLPDPQFPKPFGFYECRTFETGDPLARFPNALFLDYGRGGNGVSGPSLLRDYLVQVEPGNQDLYLGTAFVSLGLFWFPAGYFALERGPKAPDKPPR